MATYSKPFYKDEGKNIQEKFVLTDNSILATDGCCYCVWEDFAFYLMMAISDEKSSSDYPGQIGRIRIKTSEALNILGSPQYQKWLKSADSKKSVQRIMNDVKPYQITQFAVDTVLQVNA